MAVRRALFGAATSYLRWNSTTVDGDGHTSDHECCKPLDHCTANTHAAEFQVVSMAHHLHRSRQLPGHLRWSNCDYANRCAATGCASAVLRADATYYLAPHWFGVDVQRLAFRRRPRNSMGFSWPSPVHVLLEHPNDLVQNLAHKLQPNYPFDRPFSFSEIFTEQSALTNLTRCVWIFLHLNCQRTNFVGSFDFYSFNNW